MPDESVEYSRDLPSTMASVGSARRFLVWAMHEQGSQADESIATLLLSELATNAVEHGSGGSIRTTIRIDPRHLGVEVEGQSDAEPHLAERAPDTGEPKGRGLLIVDRLASRWGWTNNDRSRTVWAEMDI
jgi:anti-sigma regulatory factor (Ser/Thr protein kinase)